ncbi:drug/metabolite transporter permease [Klebsiella pneumoniae]|uniref:Drug/metabolite transporter permease n=1 Tax=Klebsiella pneumoniae TaxID=573 RepID=A0A2X3BY20_KLEPN|nr:drug/metabolite transporter permease [Klebsiella pneumoniae]
MDPLLLTFLRASIAGLLAIALLVGFRQKRPRLAQLVSLIIVSSGVVLGFPATHGAGPAAHYLGRIRLCLLVCCR